MANETAFRGGLFSGDFLKDTIRNLPDWSALHDKAIAVLRADLLSIFQKFPTRQSPNESQTESAVRNFRRSSTRSSSNSTG